MRPRTKIALGLAVAACLLAGLLIWLAITPSSREKNALVITSVGYTNQPEANFQRFARLVISNQSTFTIQLLGDKLDVEGQPNIFPRIPVLEWPDSCRRLNFKMQPGEAFTLPVRVPNEAADGSRWRLSVIWACPTFWRTKLMNWALQNKFPGWLNNYLLTHLQDNYVSDGPWLGK